MKRMIALLLVCALAAFSLSACSFFPFFKQPSPLPTQATEPATAPAQTAAPTAAATQAVTQAPAKSGGTIADYVRTAKETSFTFEDGTTRTYRIPEITLSGATVANSEIMDRFGDDIKEYTDYSPVISLDYEAYLNDNILSVIVKGSYDGGNSYGLCYSFDVTSGNSLNNSTLCSATGRNYDAAVSKLTANLTAVYDSKYGSIPGNDGERSKTLDSANINAARMYLNGSNKLMAMVDMYAAVGGGHWIDSVEAE